MNFRFVIVIGILLFLVGICLGMRAARFQRIDQGTFEDGAVYRVIHDKESGAEIVCFQFYAANAALSCTTTGRNWK